MVLTIEKKPSCEHEAGAALSPSQWRVRQQFSIAFPSVNKLPITFSLWNLQFCIFLFILYWATLLISLSVAQFTLRHKYILDTEYEQPFLTSDDRWYFISIFSLVLTINKQKVISNPHCWVHFLALRPVCRWEVGRICQCDLGNNRWEYFDAACFCHVLCLPPLALIIKF